MLRNKKYGMGGAVHSFSSPMLAQGMQGNLSGFGTSGLQTFAKGGKIGDFAKKNIGKKVKVDFRKEEGVIVGGEGDFVSIHYPTLGFTEGVNTRLENIYFVEDMKYVGDIYYGVIDYNNNLVFQSQNEEEARRMSWNYEGSIVIKGKGKGKIHKYAKGGEIIDQYEGRTPADIWFNLTKSQRRHLLLDHANIPSGELSSYIGDDTSFDELPHFVKQIVKKHFAEGQYAKGGQIASIGDSGIITDKNSMFVGKMALITGDLGNMYEVRVGERTTIVKKNGIRIISDEYANGGEIYKSAEKMSDTDFEREYDSLTEKEKERVKSLIRLGDDKKLALATILADKNNPRKASDEFYRQAYEYAEGGKTRKSGNVPRIAKKVAEVNALIEKGNELGVEVVDSSTTWQAPMKYKPIKYVNGILYIEYEELDLYSHLKRGVNQWKLKKDKVLKRNMEFDNPLNDIAKMYRKAIREREQYFSDGGEITHLPEAKKVSKEDIEQFIRYVDSFYGKNGVYADKYEGVNSKAQIRKAVMTYLNKLDSQQTWGGGAGDSLDRERVAQILKPTSKPTYAKGGETSTYEVHLEAVPNRDFDQSSHEANVRVPKLKKSAKSVAEAVSIAKKFIQDNDLGGSNFLPAKLYKNGKQVGFISYNGRVWNNDQSEMKYANGGSVNRKQSKFQLGDKVYSFYNPTKSASIVDLYFKAWDTLDNIPHENDTYFYELSLPDGTTKKLAENALSKTPLKGNKSESKSMDVQFIEYNNNEIMYEPTSKKYYANDVEFDSLLKAKKFLDSGKVSSNIRGAYKKGLFAQGGQTEEKFYAHIKHGIVPIQSVSFWKNRQSTQEPTKENIFEFLNNVPNDERICIYDSNVKSIDGELHSAKTPLYTNGAEAVSKIVDEKENIIWEKSSHNNSFAKGGDIGFIPMGLEEKLVLLAKWGGTNERGVIGLLNAMIDSGITDEDLKYTLLKKETKLRREKAIEMKIDEIWTRIQPKYNQELKGNMYYSTLKELITRSGGTYENLLQKFKPFRKYQKFAKGGEVEDKNQYDFSIRFFKDNLDVLNENYDYEDFRGTKDDVLKKVNDSLKKEEILYAYVWIENIVTDWYHESGDLERMRMELNRYGENEYAKGGKIGFEGLAKKVAKRYVGRKVSKEYQAEYGKTYDAKEAKEVGNKVAGKVYQQQVAKKKIVRKLQRKTN